MAQSLEQIYHSIRTQLQNAGIGNARNQARWLIHARTGYRDGDIIAHADRSLDSQCIEALKQDCHDLITGKPLARVLGYSEFYGLEFVLNTATLEPRPDTEILIDAARSWRRTHSHYAGESLRFIDLGTGSSCILTSLLYHWPDCYGIGVDIDESALIQARSNAALNGVDQRCAFVCSNWLDGLSGRYPLLVANPPYIDHADMESLDESVREYDPIHALDGGFDGLCSIKKLVSVINQHLTRDGAAFFEIGHNQLDCVARLIECAGLNLDGVYHDLGGIPRVVEIRYGDNSKKN